MFLTVWMLIVLTFSMLNGLFIDVAKCEANETSYWAVIVCSTASPYSARGSAAYAYHVLNAHYAFNDICYLHFNTDPSEVDMLANTTNFQWAITEWLVDCCEISSGNDVIFIYFVGHGGGIEHPWRYAIDEDCLIMAGGLYDSNEDERHVGRFEIHEEHLRRFPDEHEPYDINHDNHTTWVSVDECLFFPDANVTDDELGDYLDTLNGKYETLTFATQQCMGGGLIDDISRYDRIIITAVDEWHEAVADFDDDGLDEWSGALFDALHGEKCRFEGGEIVHLGDPVDADFDNDTHISMLNIFNYTSDATDHLDLRDQNGHIYPQIVWLSDDGKYIPTYANETNFGKPCENGTLASITWFPKRYYNLTVETRLTSETEVTGVNVWIDGELTGTSSNPLNVSAGNHDVKVEPMIYYQGSYYLFTYWYGAPDQNPTHVHIDENETVTAYYTKCNATRYMQNKKWDSTYWRQLWNNTSTYTSITRNKIGSFWHGYLGIKVFNGTTCISDGVIEVGRWLRGESKLKSTTWNCSEQNVTGTYIKIEIWCKFGSGNWENMNVAFKTKNFTENTILNATAWTIYLYGAYTTLWGPLGPGDNTSSMTFLWGSESKESRIQNMSFFTY